MDRAPEPSNQGRASAEPGGHWIRVGIVSAGLWLIVALTVALSNAQPGYPRPSGLISVAAGPAILLIVGRLDRLRGPGDWSRAAILTIGLFVVAYAVALVLLVMAYWHPD